MKKIAIIASSVALPGEKGYSRFNFLASLLVKEGYYVDLITSSFQHWEKKQRNKEKINDCKTDYNIILVDEPGYTKNIDLKRIISHRKLAKGIKEYLNNNCSKYNLIYCVIPDNHVAATAARFSKEQGIPFIIDVEDLWPEAMKMVLDIPIINNILYYSFSEDAKKVYQLCDGIVGTSDEYRDRPFKDMKRSVPNVTVYVGNEISVFDKGAEKFSNEINKSDKEFWVSYAGNLGTSYDIKTLILSAAKLKRNGYTEIRVMILGGGPLKEEFEEVAGSVNANVTFVGYVDYQLMAAYLKKSDIVINSFVKKAPQSIVTKIGDYLASGKPMINTCSSLEFKNKVENDRFGVNVEAENIDALTNAIIDLYENREKCISMGKKARTIAEEQFDRKVSYKVISDLIQRLLR